MLTVCALEGCDNTFTKRVHNQRFCSNECCRVYTNARILEQYHEKKNRKLTGRTCKQKDCDTVLSRYNEGDKCATHEERDHRNKLRAWGWEIDESQY
jgi:hypothetical protein